MWTSTVGAQSSIEALLPKITTSDNFSIWTNPSYDATTLSYDLAGLNSAQLKSNSRYAVTMGLDYGAYTLSHKFNLPFNTMGAENPLSSTYRLSVGYGKKNFEVDAELSRIKGFYTKTNMPLADRQTHYRSDITNFEISLKAYYFFNERYRYSHSMKFAYQQNKSGYTFYASLKHRYYSLSADSTLFHGEPILVDHPNADLRHLYVFDNSVTFGFSGLLTNEHWFIRGIIGMGLGMQVQYYDNAKGHHWRLWPVPASDCKVSLGYKMRGIHFSLNTPLDITLVFLPKETSYIKLNSAISFTVGFHIFELINESIERNAREYRQQTL